MKELETSLQQFGEFILRAQLVKRLAAPTASDESLTDQVRRFCEELEQGAYQEWQVHQAELAL